MYDPVLHEFGVCSECQAIIEETLEEFPQEEDDHD